MTPLARFLVGGSFAGAGLMIVAMTVDVFLHDPASADAPLWVYLTFGFMFILVGLWIMSADTPMGEALKPVVGPVVLVGILSMLHWVAFGPGVRKCSGGISLPFLSVGSNAGDLECRIGFGYVALLFDGVILGAMLSYWAESRLRGGWSRVVKGIANTLIWVPLAPFLLILVVVALLKAGWSKLRG